MVGSRVQTEWLSRFGGLLPLPSTALNWTVERANAIQDVNTGGLRSTDTYLQFAKAAGVRHKR